MVRQSRKSKKGTTNSGSKIDRGYVGHQAAKMMKRSKVLERRIDKSIEEKEQLLNNIDRNDLLTIKPIESRKNPLVYAKNLKIKFNNKPIFKETSFEVKNGDRIALVGKNGVGKSSIIKLILGENIDFEGEFKVANDLKISYVSQSAESLKGTLREIAEESKIDEGIFKSMLFKMGVPSSEFEKDVSEFSEGKEKSFNSKKYYWVS